MALQPKGTVTLLFSDIQGSTSMLEQLGPERYAKVLEEHRRLLREVFDRYEGYEVDEEGDAFLIAFGRAGDAVAAAAAGQQSLAQNVWPENVEPRVRMGLHTGEPLAIPPKYVGMDVHRAARIMAAAHGGQVVVSETTAALLDGVALHDLGEHRLKDLLEPVRLYQLEPEGLPAEFPPLRSLHRTNLPVAAWPLLGRARELEEIRSLISRGARLVTLTGTGGSGKTRLALQAAADLSDKFPDGVFFVALAPLRETVVVRRTVAEAVGLRPDDDVADWLGSRRVLLVLDNLEHLAGVDAAVGELLVGETTVVATSRGPLRLAAEREMPVDPLPDEAAVELFVSRAAAAGREVEADKTVAAVCRRLDNLPLALELAAARAKLLSPAALLERIDAALPLLTGGASDRPERQRTLRAAIEWSHDLLDQDSRAAFRRLSVFRGSFTLDTAEAIVGADVEQVAALLDQSLLKPLGEERFFMLETLREYARERLDAAEEADEYTLAQARYYLDKLEESYPERYGPRRGELQAWFADEVDNLRATVDCLAVSAPIDAARAVFLLHYYWVARGNYREEQQRSSALLARDDLPDQVRASVLITLGEAEFRLGNSVRADAAAREAVRLARPGSKSRVTALQVRADAAGISGDNEEAVRLARRAVEEAQDELRLNALCTLGEALIGAGSDEEARAVFRHGIEEAHRIGGAAASFAAPIFVADLAHLDLLKHDYESARAGFSSALTGMQSIGHYAHEAAILRDLAFALLGLGQRTDASVAFSAILDLALADGRSLPADVAEAAAGIALAAQPGRPAARLRGAAASRRELLSPRFDEFEALFEQPLIKALGRKAWQEEQAIGAAMSIEETIALARLLANDTADRSETIVGS